MRMNAAEVLLSGGDEAAIALVCDDASRRRGELRVEVARGAAVWRSRGLSRGDRVAIKLADGIDWVVAYLSVIWAGGVAVGVNPRVPADEWEAIVAAAEFRFVLGADAEAPTAAVSRDARIDVAEWRSALAAAAPAVPRAMDEDEPALWVHSSGTSGKPKAVVHAQRMAHEIARVGQERLGIRAGDRLYASSKLFFSYPLANSVFTGLRLGATVILDPRWPNAGDVAAIAMRQRPDVLFSVPSLYRNLLKEGLATQLAHCGVRRFVSAGEALPTNLRDEWKRQTGCTIVDGYGASETLVLVLVDTDEGRALQTSPGFEVTALGAPAGAPGRVLIKGPTVALGYWRRSAAQAEHFVAGGFAPSDLFLALGDSSWRFAGRDDSLVKVHGRWVDLVELEQRIAVACPWLADTAAVAVADEDGVEAVALFYVAVVDAPPIDAATLRQHADRLPPYQRPRWLHAVGSLPRTATGKLVRRRLRDLHAALAAEMHSADHDRH